MSRLLDFEQARDHLLARAADLGIDVEVLASETRELTLGSFEGELSELTDARRGGVGVRVVAEGRTGYAYSEERTEAALDWALAEAHENALLQDETNGFLPAAAAHGRSDLVGEGLSAELPAKAEAVRALERDLRADERTRQVQTSRYTERETTEVLGSTRGADGGYRNGYAALVASFIVARGGSVKQGFDLDVAKEFHALDPASTAQTMLRRTGRLLGAEPLATGRYRTWFEAPVVAQLLGLLLHSLSGKAVAEGTSRLRDRLGEPIAAAGVTLVDDPTREGGLASRPFDSEGTPARRTVLIDDGVLRSFLHNSATAARVGHENTGHASRSYKSVLGVGPSNLVLSPGAGVEPRDGVIVTDVMGLHAGADPVGGDFSLQGFGLRVEGGETRPVENFALSGNLFDLLRDVTAIGDELEWRPGGGGAIGAPMLEVASLAYGGS